MVVGGECCDSELSMHADYGGKRPSMRSSRITKPMQLSGTTRVHVTLVNTTPAHSRQACGASEAFALAYSECCGYRPFAFSPAERYPLVRHRVVPGCHRAPQTSPTQQTATARIQLTRPFVSSSKAEWTVHDCCALTYIVGLSRAAQGRQTARNNDNPAFRHLHFLIRLSICKAILPTPRTAASNRKTLHSLNWPH